jgi:hypothetical protein
MTSSVKKFQSAFSFHLLVLSVFLPLSALLISADYGNKANVYIPAHQEFVLGEYENRNYTAKISNKGKQIIKVKVVSKETGEQTQGFGLDPKSSAKVNISKSEQVVLVNNSDTEAHVHVKLSKGVEGMRYQEIN